MFYTFKQNNSGGTFVMNERVAHFVIIEADSVREANEKAESIGIYFNGVDDNIDCPCCGDRWYPTYENEVNKAPLIYGVDPANYKCIFTRKGKNYCIVYHKDGGKRYYKQSE